MAILLPSAVIMRTSAFAPSTFGSMSAFPPFFFAEVLDLVLPVLMPEASVTLHRDLLAGGPPRSRFPSGSAP